MHERHVGTIGQCRAMDVKEKFRVLRPFSTGSDAHADLLEHFTLLVSDQTYPRCRALGDLSTIGLIEFLWHVGAMIRSPREGLPPITGW